MNKFTHPETASQYQIVTGPCSTCASKDRELQAIQSLPHFLYICSSFSISIDDMVCYECRAMLCKFVKFQLRAMRVKILLDCASCKFHNENQYTELQGFPTLTQSKVHKVSTNSTCDETTIQQQETLVPQNNIPVIIISSSNDDKGVFLETECKGIFLKKEKTGVLSEIVQNELLETEEYETLSYEDEEMQGDQPEVDIEVPNVVEEAKAEEVESPKKKKRIRMKPEYPRPKTKKCDKCNKLFGCNRLLERHKMMRHTVVSLVECTMCNKKYKGEINLKNHIRLAHTDSKPHDENAYCAECNIHYPNIASYKRHLNSAQKHVGPSLSRVECHDCGKVYKNKANLQAHIEKNHLQLSCYTCNVCQKTLPSRRLLSNHKLFQHSGRPRRPFPCSVCGKSYTHRRVRDDHQNKHFGYKPYVCELCGCAYAYSAALYYHKRMTHSNKDPPKPPKPPGDKEPTVKRVRVKKSKANKHEVPQEIVPMNEVEVEISYVESVEGGKEYTLDDMLS